ncbi:MAG: hypothetical protein JXB29_03255 [Sedimentisphaerales bacterium]|nr:hypothetical protein [Sedimentisphaerales bacterium]
MKIMWEKWVAANRETRLILAFLYIHIALTISLNHTCSLACHKNSECHQKYTNDCHALCCNVESKIVLCKIGSAGIIRTGGKNCPACLYSLLAKSFEISQKFLPVAIEVLSRSQTLPHLIFIKQSEYLSSVSLRAPPYIIS